MLFSSGPSWTDTHSNSCREAAGPASFWPLFRTDGLWQCELSFLLSVIKPNISLLKRKEYLNKWCFSIWSPVSSIQSSYVWQSYPPLKSHLPCSCFTWFTVTLCFLASRYLLQFSLPWNMVVLDCQKKRLCSVMGQIILRYENVFTYSWYQSCTLQRWKFDCGIGLTFLVPKILYLQLGKSSSKEFRLQNYCSMSRWKLLPRGLNIINSLTASCSN